MSYLQEGVSASPHRPGPGVGLVGVYDTRRPALAPISEVRVSLLNSSVRGEPQSAEKLSNGKWSLSTRLVEPGPIQIEVLVRRSGLPDATRSFSWTIGGGQVHTHAAVVSTAPIGGLLETASIVLLCLVLALGALWVLPAWLRRNLLGGDEVTRLEDERPEADDSAREQVSQPIGAGSAGLK